MKGQGTHLSYLGDLEYLDHLECLGGYYKEEDDQGTQGTQHSHGKKLDLLPWGQRTIRRVPVWRAPRLM